MSCSKIKSNSINLQQWDMDVIKDMMNDGQDLGVFGYGSLLWKQGFQYNNAVIGRIEGFKRRFYQGNVEHRGTAENIGRVATLLPSKNSKVWGVMYVIKEEEAKAKALDSLSIREINLGGYDVKATTFYPRDMSEYKPCTVIVYMATPKNEYYLGEASIDTMAMQIVNAVGPCGTNIEYVTKMADYVKENIPEDKDEHLFALDKRVRELFYEKTSYLGSMGLSEFYEERKETSD